MAGIVRPSKIKINKNYAEIIICNRKQIEIETLLIDKEKVVRRYLFS